MSKYDEVEVEIIKRAYDELKALDEEGVNRALDWLRDRFAGDHEAGRKAREQAARDCIAKRASQRR